MLLVCKIPFVSQQHCPHTSHDRTAQMRKQRWNKDMISFLLLFCSDFLRESCSFYMSHYSQMVTNNYKHSLICLPLSRSAKEAEYKGFFALYHSSGDRQALLIVFPFCYHPSPGIKTGCCEQSHQSLDTLQMNLNCLASSWQNCSGKVVFFVPLVNVNDTKKFKRHNSWR